MRTTSFSWLLGLVACLLGASAYFNSAAVVRAEENPDAAKSPAAQTPADEASSAKAQPQALSPEQERLRKLYQSIVWQDAPSQGSLGTLAEVAVPEGYQFTAQQGAAAWMELCQNPPSPNLLGVLMPKDSTDWFLTFSYMDIGHVPDNEKESLDANAILESFKAGTEEGNKQRRARNWSEMHIVGWLQPPAYDTSTHNLAWAIRARSDGDEIANYDIRVLGRTGVMSVKLVANPDQVPALTPVVKQVLGGFSFKSGQKYAECAGDKVAEYGLAGLITGGAAIVAAKTGLLSKLFVILAKGGKAVILAVGALAAGIWKVVSGIFGKKARTQ